ncbi:manganese catalase family protein [Aquabacter spiritensis]|uniref:Mn-containing catalase n=1 Tax=Aquabacter spiritensis TaxID=933073 RepID=A0A4R3LUS6_9HYPH|nr:manganese catalase family protein [Aquabacter spiritensis]TCT02147.1 Mn-containing catalase [Aquabacter spiritensis]
MFTHTKHLQYQAKPDKPDPQFAKMLQEPLGGQWGEISVMMTYLFQGWSCRGPQKYRDMILDIGTEEIGHVEMLATMIARLLETSPVETQEEAAKNSAVGAIMGGARIEDAILAGMNPQHVIVAGSGPRPVDSAGNLWTAGFMAASGNLLADFRFNLTAESQGRLQVARLYNMTEDRGVRDMLSFLIARDTMHQNQWLAAIRELEEDGLEMTPVPSNFPQDQEMVDVAYQFIGASSGSESRKGPWANGPSPDGRGEFSYAEIQPLANDDGKLGKIDPRMYGTPPAPVPPIAAE